MKTVKKGLGLLMVALACLMTVTSAVASDAYTYDEEFDEEFDELDAQYEVIYDELIAALQADDDELILDRVKALYAIELQWMDDDDWYDASEFDHPNAEELLQQLEQLDEQAWAIEEANIETFETLWDREEELYSQFTEDMNYFAERLLEFQIESLEAEYAELESDLGLTQIYEQMEEIERELFGY